MFRGRPPPVFGCSTRDIHSGGTERTFSCLAAYHLNLEWLLEGSHFLSQLPSFLSERVAAIEKPAFAQSSVNPSTISGAVLRLKNTQFSAVQRPL